MNDVIHDAFSEYLIKCLARSRQEGEEVHILQVASTRISAGIEASGLTLNRVVPGTRTKRKEKKYRATFVSNQSPREAEPEAKPQIKEDAEPEFTEALLEAYRQAEYVAFVKPEISLRVGECSAPLNALLAAEGASSAAFVTAYNPDSKTFADKWNRELGMFLEHDTGVKGFKYFHGEGRDPSGEWQPEQSLLILGINKDEANGLARKYAQNAFVFVKAGEAPELVVTDRSYSNKQMDISDEQEVDQPESLTPEQLDNLESKMSEILSTKEQPEVSSEPSLEDSIVKHLKGEGYSPEVIARMLEQI